MDVSVRGTSMLQTLQNAVAERERSATFVQYCGICDTEKNGASLGQRGGREVTRGCCYTLNHCALNASTPYSA